MTKSLFIILAIFFSFNTVCAQNINCNSETNSFNKNELKLIPKEICLPKGYIIWSIGDSTDINGDGLKDFFMYWRKQELPKNGDTMYLSIYEQKKDKSFMLVRKFSNLDPIYGSKIYLREYIFQDQLFKIKIEAAVREGGIFYYYYDNNIKNWVLKKQEYWIESPDGNSTKIKSMEKPPKEITLDKFNYKDVVDNYYIPIIDQFHVLYGVS